MNETVTVYLGGPVKYSDDPHGWRNSASEVTHLTLSDVRITLEWLNPLSKYDSTRDTPVQDHKVVEDDIKLIDQADIMLVGDWNSGVRSVGTPMEILYANYVRPMPVIAFGDIHRMALSPWFRYHVDEYCEYLSDAHDAVLSAALDIARGESDRPRSPSGFRKPPEWEDDVNHEFASNSSDVEAIR